MPLATFTPKDMMAGRQHVIHAGRDRKLEAARKQRQIRLKQAGCIDALCSDWGGPSLKLPDWRPTRPDKVNTALLIAETVFGSGHCTGILTGAPEIQAALS